MQNRPNPNAPRRMTRQQYEALMRQRRQNRIAIAIIAGIAVLIITAVILILKPKGSPDAVTAMVEATAVPATAQPVAESAGGSVPDLAAMTDTEPSGQAGALTEEADDDDGEDAVAAEVTPVPELPRAIDRVVSTRRPDGSLRSVRMRVVGDIMFCQTQLVYARDSGYDFHNQFEMIAEQLADADYTMGNMEGTIGKYKKSQYSGYPQFNAPDVALAPLKDYGIDFLTLANNHMLDRWSGGVENTVNNVEKYGFAHVGAYRTKAEKAGTVICEVGGIKFGFMAYTHTTNSMENRGVDKEAVDLVPYISKADFKGDVKKLRDAGAEVIIAFPHWGKEYVREPDDSQKKYAKQLAEAGVDIIIGSHAHEVQPMGYQNVTVDGVDKQVLTMFCMGNFISDHVLQYTDNGIILDFTVNEQPGGRFTCDSVGYIPTYTWKQNGAVKVLPSGRYLENRPTGMDDENYNRMVASYYEIVEVFGDQFQLING
ncbi:MAG: CapA family protein [Clostridia bacterium]|nr:CapA family protein [Clostridia bacterium]